LIDKLGRDRFFAGPLAEMTVDNNTYAIPLYSHAQVMWVRKDLLEKAGLPIPQTWDELYETAKKLTKKPDVYGLSVPTGSGDLMGTRFLNFYVRSAGETLLTKDGKANITSKAAIDGINYWVKVYRDCSPEDSINYKVLDQATLYYQGKTAFDFNSGFQIGGVTKNSPDLVKYIDAAPMPKINASDPVRGIETSNIPLVVWKNCKTPEVAKAFIEFLYEKDRYVKFLHSVPAGMLPAFKDVITYPEFTNEPTIQAFSNAVKVISDAVNLGTAIGFENGPRAEAGLLTSQNVIEIMFQDIITKNTPVEQAAKAAEDKLNELFKTVN
jgi:multiple sugar transport system substrate-binding protein